MPDQTEGTKLPRLAGKIIPPKLLFLISIIGMIVIAGLVILEYRARQADYLRLLENQATLFINTVSSSAENAFNAAQGFEEEINRRILAGLKIIERSERNSSLNDTDLQELLKIAQLDAIQVYNSEGSLVSQAFSGTNSLPIPEDILKSRLESPFESEIFSLYDFPSQFEERMVFCIPRNRGGLLAALVSNERFETLRSQIGFGHFLKRFQSEENVEYVVLQNRETIIAGSFEGYPISSFSRDPFPESSLTENRVKTRILSYKNNPVYEAVSPFEVTGEAVGVLRLGLSLQEYQKLAEDVRSRLYMFAAILIVVGLIFVNFLVSYRHRYLLRRDLERLQDYTRTILDNLQSGVLSINRDGSIQSANKQALGLLGLQFDDVHDKHYSNLPEPLKMTIESCLYHDSGKGGPMRGTWQVGRGQKRTIDIRSSVFRDESGEESCVLLLDDVTEQRRFEEQVHLNEKLIALQKLASSVAHEIKNPLNSIRLIVDLIRKKTKPAEGAEAYYENLETVQKEISRISGIVEQYLRFARPPKMTPSLVNLSDLLADVSALFESQLEKKRIEFKTDLQEHGEITGDYDQLKQVFINLIKNAAEAIDSAGEISVTGKVLDGSYEVRIRDSGTGIPNENLGEIFNLHFTTKKGGSGIGLSVVRQIVMTHNGTIEVVSTDGEGSTFILRLPLTGTDRSELLRQGSINKKLSVEEST